MLRLAFSVGIGLLGIACTSLREDPLLPADAGPRDAAGSDADAAGIDAASDAGPSECPCDSGQTCWERRCVTPVGADVGAQHACAVVAEGDVYCWGTNQGAQLGTGDDVPASFPRRVELAGERAEEVCVGHAHSCARLASGRMVCWGTNGVGRLGDGTLIPRPAPAYVGAKGELSGVTAITCGALHTCAIASGFAYCWGYNGNGQIGIGTVDTLDHPAPVEVVGTGADPLVAIDASDAHTCVLATTGSVSCWGQSGLGEAGGAMPGFQPSPQTIAGVTGNGIAIAVGSNHSCALTTNGVFCWGDNSRGQLGGPAAGGFAPAVLVTGATGAEQISAGDGHTCARGAGWVRCWGSNLRGQIGLVPDDAPHRDPVSIDSVATASAIGAGSQGSCAVVDGALWCWGSDRMGQLGRQPVAALAPVDVVGSIGSVRIAAGGAHTCIHQGGSTQVSCFGHGAVGELGMAAGIDRSTPGMVPEIDAIIRSLSAGPLHSCAVEAGGLLRCWGFSPYGGAGVPGGVANADNPLEGAYVDVAAGRYHSCAVETGGRIVCFGLAENGVLGASMAPSATATPIPVDGIVMDGEDVDATTDHNCAELTGGRAACWGLNVEGQVGWAGGPGTVGTPYIIPGTGDVTQISAGGRHSCAVIEPAVPGEVNVRCWGANDRGQLGRGGTEPSSDPAPGDVLGVTDAMMVDAGLDHTCVLRATGHVSCWGINSSGQLGDGTFVDRHQPTQVPGLERVNEISAGGYHTCAATDDRTVCWGLAPGGRLGDGRVVASQVPEPVGDSAD